MSFIIRPWQIFIICLSGWVNRQQRHVIEYLIAENLVLKENSGKSGFFLTTTVGTILRANGNEPALE